MIVEAHIAVLMTAETAHGPQPTQLVRRVHNPDLRRDGDSVVWTRPDGMRVTARWLALLETDDEAEESPRPAERRDDPGGSPKGPGRGRPAGRRAPKG